MMHLIPAMMNRYGGHCEATDHELRAYDSKGKLVVYLQRDGNGSIVDKSEAFGLEGRYNLAPIPKEARLWKHDKAGKLVKTTDHEARKEHLAKFKCSKGFVKSCEELESEDWSFDSELSVKKEPQQKT